MGVQEQAFQQAVKSLSEAAEQSSYGSRERIPTGLQNNHTGVKADIAIEPCGGVLSLLTKHQ